MPTTPSSAVPYPALTDVPDVPYWLKQLAEFIDAALLKGSNLTVGDSTSTSQFQLIAQRKVGADAYDARLYIGGTAGNSARMSLVKNGTVINRLDLAADGSLVGGGAAKPVPQIGSFAGTPDANGYLTVTHGLGFTPSAVVATPRSPITAGAAANIFASALTDSYTATQFRVRCIAASGVAMTVAVAGSWAAS